MSNPIRKRVQALEAQSGMGRRAITVVLRRLVRPGAMEAAKVIRSYGTSSAWSVEREAGESEDAFRERACATAPRTGGGVVRLVEA